MWPPYIQFNFETNKPEGLVVDLMENIASKINLELEWPEETGWGNMTTSLNTGRVDVACSTLWNDPTRGRDVAFTDPVFYIPVYPYVLAGSSLSIKTISDINKPNIRVSVQDGDFTTAITNRLFPNAQKVAISSTNSWTEVLMQVALDKADIVFLNSSAAINFNKNNDKKLEKIDLPEPVTVYGNSFAVSIHEPDLKEVLNTAVQNLIQTGEIEKLTEEFRKKYPGEILLPSKPYQVEK